MKDIVYVEHQYYVSSKQNSIRFVNLVTKEERFMPFGDVEWLVFDDERSYFSKQLMTACSKNNIGVLFCDQKHSPLTVLNTDFGHSKRLVRLKDQINLDAKTKNRLWRKIVIAKIMNQAECVANETKQFKEKEYLKIIGKKVTEGDKMNQEAHAARLYFSFLFGKGFRRGRFQDAINASLNYGYALLRAEIRRQIAFHGLEPSIGIHHESSENPFNLSDDFIEAYRPFVDALVYEHIYRENVMVLNLAEKKKLLGIFFEKCVIDGKVYTVTDAIGITVSSYVQCLEQYSAAPLKLPQMIEVGR